MLRRRRTDMPTGVARNYAGTAAVLVVPLAVRAGRPGPPLDDRRPAAACSTTPSSGRIAYIGDRAPDAFRANVQHTDTFTIQAGAVYRTCVPRPAGTRTYCVIVNTHCRSPAASAFAGYEPNRMFSQGAN